MIPERKRGLAAVREESPRLGHRLLSPAGLLELYPAIAPRTLRRWIQQAAPVAVRSQGQEKVLPGNGLGPAVIRKGRVTLIDPELFRVWLYEGRVSD